MNQIISDEEEKVPIKLKDKKPISFNESLSD